MVRTLEYATGVIRGASDVPKLKGGWMPGFRDICLQVRYESSFAELTRDFFGIVCAIARQQRAHVWSLSRDSLQPVSLHYAECMKVCQPLQVLICLEQPESVADLTARAATANSECLAALAWIGAAAHAAVATEDDAAQVDLQAQIAVCPPIVASEYSSTRCVGQLRDEFGNGVEYLADWGEETSESGTKRQLAVSWSWGDPSFRVTKGITRSDLRWTGRDLSIKTVAASDDLVLSLRAALVGLIRAPVESVEPQRGRDLFRHQKEAVDQWMAQDCRGVFKMCTGAGKTIAALAGARAFGDRQHVVGACRPPVVVTVPTRILADQWIQEIKRFGFPVPLAGYNAFDQWSELLVPYLRVKDDSDSRFVVTTYCSFADDRFTARLKRAGEAGVRALWIADEMHNLSSHRLRQAMREDAALFQFRLGLSATPDIENDFAATEFLKEYFGPVCKSYELRDGIADRVLCRYRYYPVPAFLDPALGGQYLALLAQIHGPGVDPAKLVNLYRQTRQLLRTSGVQLSRFADLLKQLVAVDNGLAHTLVYCPPGYGTYGSDLSDEIDRDADELRLIEGVVGILRANGLSTASILGETPGAQRKEILKRFGKATLQTLCAIGCLDEGVDVPSIRRAIVLYSIDRERQFVQRRGRILRNPTRDDQKIAEIHDIVLLPQGSDMPAEQAESLLARELRRYRTFADLAMNREEADRKLSNALISATRQRNG